MARYPTDLSVSRHVDLLGGVGMQIRLDVFNLLNQVNLGPPGDIVGTPAFGKITRTRLPAGEAGSARQIQLAVKLAF